MAVDAVVVGSCQGANDSGAEDAPMTDTRPPWNPDPRIPDDESVPSRVPLSRPRLAGCALLLACASMSALAVAWVLGVGR